MNIESDLAPDERQALEIFEVFLDAHHSLSALMGDITAWISQQQADGHDGLESLIARHNEAIHGQGPERLEFKQKEDGEWRRFEPSPAMLVSARAAFKRALEIKATYQQMVTEMILVNLVASFEAFLADLLRHVLVCRPELLKASGKELAFTEIVEAGSWERLISTLAEKEVRAMSFRRQLQQLRKRFAVPDRDDFDEDALVEAYARRNLLLHNRGIVNQTYLELAPGSDAKLGERLTTDPSYLDQRSREFVSAAQHVGVALSARHLGGVTATPGSD